MNTKVLGQNIRFERRKREISQEKLGEYANLSTNSIVLIEKGKQIPNAIHLYLIAKALKIDINDLFKGIDDTIE